MDTDKMVEKNMLGITCERQGDYEQAIKLYEENIFDRFEGNHPYDRLAIYYRKLKDYDNEIRVLEAGIDVFTYDVDHLRMDRIPKLLLELLLNIV